MLDRRCLLRTILAGGMLGPRLVAAQRPLGGVLEKQENSRFSNATIVDAKGQIKKNWGAEIVNGMIRFSADILDGENLNGRWIVPNFVDSGCTVGLYEVGLESGTHDHSEAKESERPLLQPSDGYNPLSEVIPTIRANGIGTVLVHPALDRLVSGTMSAMYTSGMTRAEALCAARIGICVGLGGAGKGHDGPSTRMGIAVRLREIFSELSPTIEKTDEKHLWWKKKEESPKEIEGEDAIWQEVADGQLPVLFSAQRADDIEFALDLINEFQFSGMIVGGAEAWLHADRLAAASVPVLLGSLTVQPSSFEHLHARYDNAKLLQEAGVTLAFRSGSNHNSRLLPSEAAVAVAHGLPFAEAIKALCYNAGEIFPQIPQGFVLDSEESIPAHCFICDGDPLQPRNQIHRMWINGEEVDLRTRQTELYKQYKELR